MRSKVTYILLALNLALFGYLLLSERPWSATQRIEENRRRVLGPEAANLSAIEIASYDAPAEGAPPPAEPSSRVRLERRGKSWFLAAPFDWPANDYAVEPMLTGLQFLEHETSFPVAEIERNGQSLADYGLDQPRLVVTCTPAAESSPEGAAAAPFTLRIGRGAEVGNRLYVLSPDGRRIHVVGPALLETLGIDVARLRTDHLLGIPVFEARALTIQTPAGRARLRREQDRWAFEAPVVTRAARTPVEVAINDLNALRVARFLPPSPALAPALTGLDKPAFRMTLEGNSRRDTLLLGRPVEEKPAADSGSVEFYARLDERPALFTVAVPSPLLKTLESPLLSLRDPRILDLDVSRVAAVAISAPRLPELRIQKLDAAASGPAEWQLLRPSLASPIRADAELVNNLLLRLRLLEASAPAGASPYVSDAPDDTRLENLGFKRPERVVTIEFERAADGGPVASAPPVTLELAMPGGPDSGLYARVVGQPHIYSVPPDTLDYFPVVPRVLRDRVLHRLPESVRVTRLVLRRAGASETPPVLDYTPAAGAQPSAEVAVLLGAVRELRARRVERESYPALIPVDGVEKPWAYTLEATLDPAPAEGSFVLSLAERAGGTTQLAGSERLGLVFTLEQPVLDALWKLLYPAPAAP